MFRTHLRECQVDYLGPNPLNSQYNERFRNAAWRTICKEPQTDADRDEQNDIVARVEQIAESLTTAELASSRAQKPETVSRHFRPGTPRTQKCIDSGADIVQNQLRPPRALKRLRPSATDPLVIIPTTRRGSAQRTMNSTGLPTPPRTPQSAHSTERVPLKLLNGLTISVSPQNYAMAQSPYQAPAEEEVHLDLTSSLFFRYWNEDAYNRRSSTGVSMNSVHSFTAGRFVSTNVTSRTVPRMADIPVEDLWNHLNNEEVASPFISVSNLFAWSLRILLKEVKRGANPDRLKLAVINAEDIAHAAFYSKPILSELRRMHVMTPGNHRYFGSHEWLIWKEIPRSAIVHTFSLSSLLDFASASPLISRALGVEILGIPGAYRNKILPSLRRAGTRITMDIASALAELVRFLGLTTDSPIGQLTHITTDLLKGHGILTSFEEVDGWETLADHYAHSFAISSPKALSLQTHLKLRLAFLEACSLAQGEWNVKLKPELMYQMRKRAKRLGLGDPGKLLADSLDGAKLQVLLYDRERRELSNTRPRPSIVTVESEDEMSVDREDEMSIESEDEKEYEVLRRPGIRRAPPEVICDEDIIYESE